MKKLFFVLTIVFLGLAITSCKTTQKTASSSDTSKEENKKSPYEKIFTDKTITQSGLFTVHRNDQKIYFEIPDSLIGRDMLLVSRLVALPPNYGGGYVNAGSKTNEEVVRWEKSFDHMLLRSVSYNAVASDSLPIHESVMANNFQPILYSFKIVATAPNSSRPVIEVSDLFVKDVPAISPINSRLKKAYKVKRLDENRTFIQSVKSFPQNIEIRHELTFEADEPPTGEKTGALTFLMNQSLVLLPTKLMRRRLYDERVGWFTVSQIDYGSPLLKSDQKRYIRKWNLIPKDKEAYARGELVEPVKPIIYYIDPATPEKWRPYFKAGIELWQKAFETAGFKNAIIARNPPTPEEDPDFSPEDVRYSVVRYVASTTRNAVGPSVSDPRTGEIIESDIIWYHNHLRSYRNRYMLETGAANPSARTLITPDKDIGEMMKMVIAHEVGHSLGLPHNMKASAAYPTDSLRSGTFTQKYGIAASIMDYARYNYVAQPGDKNIRFIRQLGPYDHYAINWGYRYLPENMSYENQQKTLAKWIKEKQDDPKYQFGNGYDGVDPDSQTEGIGKDPVKASTYGLSNLKIVAQNLPDWTKTEDENYDDLTELYGELVQVWERYIGHVVTLIGGVRKTLKTTDQVGSVYVPVSGEEQRNAVNFINKNVFLNQEWLIPKDITRNIESHGSLETIRKLQESALSHILTTDRIVRMVESKTFEPDEYGPVELMDDLRHGIWNELISSTSISATRRNLQRTHIDLLGKLVHPDSTNSRQTDPSISDVTAIARAQLFILKTDIQNAKNRMSDNLSRYHLSDCLSRIDEILDIDK